MKAKKKKDLLFYIAIVTIPIIQFVVMWGIVNINTLRLAFMTWDYETGKYVATGFQNFRDVISDFFGTNVTGTSIITPYAVKNSIIAYFVTLLVNMPLGLIFAFYVHKKMRFAKAFQAVLYLPCIVSVLVMTTIYLYFAEEFIPDWFPSLGNEGLLSNPDTAFITLIIFTLFYGFGNSAMIYVSTMNSINPSIIEAAKMDGCNAFQEFIHIYFPACYSILKISLSTGLMGILGNSLNAYAFFGSAADEKIHTIGYCIQVQTLHNSKSYPYLSAYAILISIFVVPFVLQIKKFLDRIDPSRDTDVPKKNRKKEKHKYA